MIKRGSKEAKILAYIQHRPDEPIEAVAKKLKLKNSTVRSAVQKLKASNLIHRIAVINYQKLGYTEYSIFISLRLTSKKLREEFIAKCVADPYVNRIEEFGGDFEYCISFLSKNPQEVSKFLESFGAKIGNIITDKSISILESYTGFGRRYLSGIPVTPIVKLENKTNDFIKLDEVDLNVLRELVTDAERSHRELAQAAALSQSTLTYRIQRLLASGAIQSFIYGVRSRLIDGCSRFRLLVYATAVTSAFRKNFEEYLTEHTEVVNYSRLLGAADFMVQVEVFEPQQVFLFAQELREHFPSEIGRVSILPFFGHRKNSIFSLVQ